MTPVDRRDGSGDDGRPFEQWLLDSAREDELPRDVSGAWARFGASLASASGLAATGSVGMQPSSGGALAHVARFAAVKWLIVGAFAGSALTFAWVRHAHHSRAGEAVPARSVFVVASALPAVSVPSATPSVALSGPEVLAPRAPSVPVHRDTRAPASSLGAQVVLLDSARAALTAGSFSAALQATDRYEHQFPAGELRPEADVVAIEALAARGDEAACRERAARFLERYPTDPHAARVKALAERAASALPAQ
jgi:hypothetical protein